MAGKNKNRIKLSFAIPTYNGARYIREALDGIISQFDNIEENIEIVISDNASVDQTPEIIREYQKKHSFIRYFRNKENLGPDKNCYLAVQRSRGEFVWLFSDDDELRPGAIKKVLNVLKANKNLAAIFVNFRSYDAILKQYDAPPVLRIQKDRLFERADDFLSQVQLKATFVSSLVVCRSLWEAAKPEEYIGSNCLHYATLLTLIKGRCSYCIAEPYVKHMARPGYIRSGDSAERSMRCIITWMKVINGLFKKGYAKTSINKVKRAFLRHLPMELIVHKKNGLILKKELIKEMIAQFKFYPSFWLIDLPLLLVPNFFHKIAFKIYKLKPINKIYRGIRHKFS